MKSDTGILWVGPVAACITKSAEADNWARGILISLLLATVCREVNALHCTVG
jgi:hypothetical protein